MIAYSLALMDFYLQLNDCHVGICRSGLVSICVVFENVQVDEIFLLTGESFGETHRWMNILLSTHVFL